MASQITGVFIVCSTVGSDQRKRQSSASLAFVRGIHRWSVNSPYKRPVTRKMFPFDDIIMVFKHYDLTLGFLRTVSKTIELIGFFWRHGCCCILCLIARLVGPTWGPSGAGRTQVAPCWPHELCYLGLFDDWSASHLSSPLIPRWPFSLRKLTRD